MNKKKIFEEIKDERAREFVNCLGNGKSIYECEAENAEKDKFLSKMGTFKIRL